MSAALLLAAFVCLLLAGATLLWWELPWRIRQQQSIDRINRLSGVQEPPPTHVVGAESRHKALADATPAVRYVEELLTRAGLPATLTTALWLLGPCVAVSLLAWWRLPGPGLVLLCLVVSLLAVGLFLRRRIDKRLARITAQLPGFLDDMVRMASIGNSLPMAFGATYTSTEPPLRTILDSAMGRVRSGGDLDWALAQATRPYHLESLEMLHVVLGISMRMGGRSDHILQRISHFLRDHERAQREFVATTAETRMSAWVIGLLPIASGTVMALFSPEFFRPLFTTTTGHHILAIALVLELVGVCLLVRLARSL
ncbi:type II secretion system F family protein [Frateuria aurantia]